MVVACISLYHSTISVYVCRNGHHHHQAHIRVHLMQASLHQPHMPGGDSRSSFGVASTSAFTSNLNMSCSHSATQHIITGLQLLSRSVLLLQKPLPVPSRFLLLYWGVMITASLTLEILTFFLQSTCPSLGLYTVKGANLVQTVHLFVSHSHTCMLGVDVRLPTVRLLLLQLEFCTLACCLHLAPLLRKVQRMSSTRLLSTLVVCALAGHGKAASVANDETREDGKMIRNPEHLPGPLIVVLSCAMVQNYTCMYMYNDGRTQSAGSAQHHKGRA